jgi:YidC/Oxa1 family membrane protein insertase
MGTIWFTFVGFFEQVLMFLAVLTGSMALGVIIFTIFARLAILPLTLKSIRSSRKMQEVQPLIKEIQRKYGKDQKRMTEETMKLYQEHKINPVGGCLPLFLQLPIFIGVYQAIIHLMLPAYRESLGTEMRAAIVDSNIEPLLNQPLLGGLWNAVELENANIFMILLDQNLFGVINLGLAPFAEGFSVFNGPQYLILPVLSVVLQFTQQLMAMPRVQDPQQKMMSQMMMFMPLVFAYIALTFPAGAVLYWVTSSVVGILQQYFTSGWGSLANYLKFLPADTRARQPVAQADTSATGSTETEGEEATSGEEAATAAPEPRPSFWDVLRPLVEADTPAVATAAASPGGDGAPELPPADAPAEQPDTTPQRQERSRQKSPRRTRHRR